MRAISIKVGTPGASLVEVPEPQRRKGEVLLRTLYTGICGTDRGLVGNQLSFARPPPGSASLIIGHEALARVEDVDPGIKLRKGSLVVPMVRRPGKCLNCLIGRQDNCSDGDFVEAGIRGLDGFMRDYFTDDPTYLVRVEDESLGMLAVLTEPLKNIVKAYDVYDLASRRAITNCRDGSRSCLTVTIAGAGPIGMLFAMMFNSVGMDVKIFSRHDPDGTLSEMASKIGAEYFLREDRSKPIPPSDVFVETSGSPNVAMDGIRALRPNGVAILFGTAPSGSEPVSGQDVIDIVERNITVIGTVDGAKEHYIRALSYLSSWKDSYPGVLKSMITAIVSPEEAPPILAEKPRGEIKSVIKWE
ncbi:MAG: glucose 1-dehydrogenase [Conexivisphaera sp.]